MSRNHVVDVKMSVTNKSLYQLTGEVLLGETSLPTALSSMNPRSGNLFDQALQRRQIFVNIYDEIKFRHSLYRIARKFWKGLTRASKLSKSERLLLSSQCWANILSCLRRNRLVDDLLSPNNDEDDDDDYDELDFIFF